MSPAFSGFGPKCCIRLMQCYRLLSKSQGSRRSLQKTEATFTLPPKVAGVFCRTRPFDVVTPDGGFVPQSSHCPSRSVTAYLRVAGMAAHDQANDRFAPTGTSMIR